MTHRNDCVALCRFRDFPRCLVYETARWRHEERVGQHHQDNDGSPLVKQLDKPIHVLVVSAAVAGVQWIDNCWGPPGARFRRCRKIGPSLLVGLTVVLNPVKHRLQHRTL